MLQTKLKATLPLLVAIALAGCAKGPTDEQFLDQAAKEGQQAACLNLTSGFPSIQGGLPGGGLAFDERDDGGSFYGGGVRPITKAGALEDAGLLQSLPATLFRDGQQVPGKRFYLTDAGRAAMSSRRSEYGGGGGCFLVGYKEPVSITSTKDAAGKEQHILKSTVDNTEMYAAQVRFEVKTPADWVNKAKVQQAFGRELAEAMSSKEKRVELVKFSDAWVSRDELARRMSNRPGGMESVSEIPAGQENVVKLRIEEQAQMRFRGEIQLPLESSETTPEMRKSNPASIFFAAVPDNTAYLGKLATSTQPTAIQSDYMVRQRDSFLTRRAELLETLDVLVAQGVMQRKPVAAGDSGAPTAGTLYTAVSGERRLRIGTLVANGLPSKATDVRGKDLEVTVPYTWVEVPAWVKPAAEKLPFLRTYLSGGTIRATVMNQKLPSGDERLVVTSVSIQ